MLCQKCKKNQANTYVKRIINGNLKEYHLCNECANDIGYDNMFSSIVPSFSNILEGLFNMPSSNSIASVTRCKLCGSSVGDIINSGKIGCANCYTTFKRELMPSIKKMHGNTIHCGKGASSKSDNNSISLDSLKNDLKQAIEMQEFEKAATLRDQIKELESKKEVL